MRRNLEGFGVFEGGGKREIVRFEAKNGDFEVCIHLPGIDQVGFDVPKVDEGALVGGDHAPKVVLEFGRGVVVA